MINNKSIGRKLKELRNSRDLKQSELAEMAGYARVSTDEQKKYGYSIQAQTEEITQRQRP